MRSRQVLPWQNPPATPSPPRPQPPRIPRLRLLPPDLNSRACGIRPRFLWHSHSWLCGASHHPSRTKARQSQTVPLESSPHDLPAKRTRTGKNACATLEPTSHDLLPSQPSSLASRRQIHLYHLEAVRLFACLHSQENSHSHE